MSRLRAHPANLLLCQPDSLILLKAILLDQLALCLADLNVRLLVKKRRQLLDGELIVDESLGLNRWVRRCYTCLRSGVFLRYRLGRSFFITGSGLRFLLPFLVLPCAGIHVGLQFAALLDRQVVEINFKCLVVSFLWVVFSDDLHYFLLLRLSQSANFINERLFLLFRHWGLAAWFDFRLLSYWGFHDILGRCDGLLQLAALGWLSHRRGLRLLGFGDVDLFVAEAQLIKTLQRGKLKLVHSIVKRRVSGRCLGHRLEDLVHVDGDRSCGLVFELLERFLYRCEGLELGLHLLAGLRVFEKLDVLG